jgi:hypothetical protein
VNKMIDWTRQAAKPLFDPEAHLRRLLEIGALLTAIDQGELLSDLPAEPTASARHVTGACLLAVLERELARLIEDLEISMDRGAFDGEPPAHG